MLAQRTQPADLAASRTVALSCQDLRFRYTKASGELFGGLTHEFRPGAITAVLGPSGRGKSTLLYVLGLMLTPTQGQVCYSGVAVSRLPDAGRARLRSSRVGFVFQDSALDPSRKVIDSIVEPSIYAGWPRSRAVVRAREFAQVIGVQARLDHRPGAISGGEAQRVALCRALLNDPEVVLADEPTGNLDMDNSEIVLGLLRRAADEGKTVVVATHDRDLMDQVDAAVRL
jgi:putative ABC transport system ATP-binding protein/lipoprotein-releasing system ATP-binding protein